MNNKSKIKAVIKERIFELYEAFEIDDKLKIHSIENTIRYQINRYEGWKLPMKDFVYEFMDNEFKITFQWMKMLEKTNRKKTVRNNYGFLGKIKTTKFYNKKYIILSNISIARINKTQEAYE